MQAAPGSSIWLLARSFDVPTSNQAAAPASDLSVLEVEAAALLRQVTVVRSAVDVTDAASADAFFTDVLSDAGCDVLVNNAGGGQDGLVLRLSDQAYLEAFQLNFMSAVRLTRLALRGMIKRRFGRIIQMSSMATKGNPGQAAYASSKAALEAHTKSSAREVAARGVTVNAVSPGFVDTAMTRKLSAELQGKIAKMAALSRMASAAEIADVVGFLASDEASYITAQIVEVHGGLSR